MLPWNFSLREYIAGYKRRTVDSAWREQSDGGAAAGRCPCLRRRRTTDDTHPQATSISASSRQSPRRFDAKPTDENPISRPTDDWQRGRRHALTRCGQAVDTAWSSRGQAVRPPARARTYLGTNCRSYDAKNQSRAVRSS